MNIQFDGAADLSSRTPFARLWTAVQIQTTTDTGRKWPMNEDKKQDRKKDYLYKTKNTED